MPSPTQAPLLPAAMRERHRRHVPALHADASSARMAQIAMKAAPPLKAGTRQHAASPRRRPSCSFTDACGAPPQPAITI